MNKKLILLLLICLLGLLAGCWDINEIENTQFPAYIAVDSTNQPDFYKYSFEFPILREKAPKEVNDISTINNSLQGAIENIQSRTMGWISLGMLRTVIFSSQVAKEGLITQIDGLWRNPLVPGTVNLAVTNQSTAKLKKVKAPTTANLGDYLESLFNTSSRNSLLPQRTINNFFIDLKTRGIEPTIPLIKYGATDINIIGMAIFDGDKMVGTIDQPQARALLLLKEKYTKGSISLEVNNYMVSYYVQQIKAKINPIYKQDKFLFDIDLSLEVDISENTSHKRLVGNTAAVNNMERHLAAALKKEIRHLFNKLQKYRSDALGIGSMVRANQPHLFDPDTWPLNFSRGDITTNVEVEVRRIGIST